MSNWRYAVTAGFTVALVVLGALAHGVFAAEEGEDRRDPLRFGVDAAALHKAGWSLAWLAHEDGGEGKPQEVALTLVDAPRAHAVRLALAFSDDGEQMLAYTRASVPVPATRRVYEHEDALFGSLDGGGAYRLYEECGTYFLDSGDGQTELPEYDYIVPVRHVDGADAGRALAEELRTRLRGGADLADVHESEDGLAFVLVDAGAAAEAVAVVSARLDAAGGVIAVDVRLAPAAFAPGKLGSEARLARALRGRSVRRVSLSMVEDATRVKIEFTRGKSYVIDLADMEYPQDEGCGC